MTAIKKAADALFPLFKGIDLAAPGYTAAAIKSAERRLGILLPKALKDFYRHCGRVEQVSNGVNHFLQPEELYVADDGLCLLEDAQRYYLWGTRVADLALNDPPAVQTTYDAHEWWAFSDSVERFIVDTMCWIAVNAAAVTVMAKHTPDFHPAVSKSGTFVSNSVTVGQKIDSYSLIGDGVVVVACPNEKAVYLGGSRRAVTAFQRRHRIDWTRL